jgi:hypothetical protein
MCSGDVGVYSGEAIGEMVRRGEAGSTTFSCCSPISSNHTLAVNPWESQRRGDSTGKRSGAVQLFGNTGAMSCESARVVAGSSCGSAGSGAIVAAGATSGITSTTPAMSRTARRHSEERINLLMQEVARNTSVKMSWERGANIKGKP